MKRLTQLIPILFLLFSFSAAAQSGGIDFFEGTMEEAMAKAKEENKILFVDAYTVSALGYDRFPQLQIICNGASNSP